MLDTINVYFGKVVDIDDNEKLFRCRVHINGYTEKIPVADLDWYYPWYGYHFLPQLNDIVPVYIFDKNFNTGFFHKKVDLVKSRVSDSDYENYLEIFKRDIDGDVSLTYTESEGIVFNNVKSKIQLLTDKILLQQDSNQIEMTKDKIKIGSKGLEPTLLGDKTVQELKDIITHQQNCINNIYAMFNAIAAAALPLPFTKAIGLAIQPLVAANLPTLLAENAKLTVKAGTIQSKKVSNE